jgi:hypothetical protein
VFWLVQLAPLLLDGSVPTAALRLAHGFWTAEADRLHARARQRRAAPTGKRAAMALSQQI